MKDNKKLIEVALPLDAINVASAREKSIRHGHPSTLHLWWARRPLAAARAVIFAQMVDDPSAHTDLFPTEKKQDKERQRLFRIIEDLVKWENSANVDVLERAKAEIWQSWRRTCAENADHPKAKELFDRHKLPAFHDPFAGGGALPLEAQRLGLDSHASDLNPVAVLINKAMIEIPPKFAGRPPVNPDASAAITRGGGWQGTGAQGLADDVRYYGEWTNGEAARRIGHLYPNIEITAAMAIARPDLKRLIGQKLTVIAWLWARTVKSPNPAFAHVDVPLASSFTLASKPGKEAYVSPAIAADGYTFTVKVGNAKDAEDGRNGTKLARGANFRCLMSGTPIAGDYIKSEGQAGRIGVRLMAIVAEGSRERVYLSPTPEHERIARCQMPADLPPQELPSEDTANFWCTLYGLTEFTDLFTARQLTALTTFADVVQETIERVRQDAKKAGLADDGKRLADGGTGAAAYADAIAVYLALGLGRSADFWCSLATWSSQPKNELVSHGFTKQAIPMTWDFGEVNPFSNSGGNFTQNLSFVVKCLERFGGDAAGFASQADASTQSMSMGKVVSTDPPYYDNISYADLSDFFYMWLRRSLRTVFPDLFATLAVPKSEELVASPYRHGSQDTAETFFLSGMTQAMHRLSEQAHPGFPLTIYYAFKQSETTTAEGTASTGWETFLDAVIRAGLSITGTWPIRTERGARSIGIGTNALASSIVLVCRGREHDAPIATRREFLTSLKSELPGTLAHLQRGNIAPVDLAQAAIGPGMGVYTRYSKVVDAKGEPLSVREALALINQTLDEALAEQEGDFDADSRWALAWFEQSGFSEGDYGMAETLSTAKNTSVGGMVESGILSAGRGKVRLLRPDELPVDWDPEDDRHTNTWEMLHHMIRVLEHAGEAAAAQLVAKYGAQAEVVRELAYRLYTLCERKKRAQEAVSYNALVQSWPEIMRLVQESATKGQQQAVLFDQE
jgi:putative DNA methylase